MHVQLQCLLDNILCIQFKCVIIESATVPSIGHYVDLD